MKRVGIAFSDRPHIRDYVRFGRLAEELGYDSIWVTEPRMARDAITGMAVLAAATERIKIGSAVINNWTRGPGLTAVTFATLDALAPGRILLGLGSYWDPLAANQGITRTKPLTAMREYIEVLRKLWNLERVSYDGQVVKVNDLELDAAHAADLAYGPEYASGAIHIPIYLGPSRDRMLELSGEIADGVLMNTAFSTSYVRHALERIHAGAARVGRDSSQIDTPKMLMVALTDGSDDAWKATKRKITRYLGQQPHIQEASGLTEVEIEPIRAALGGWPPRPGGVEAAANLVPDAVAKQLAVVGTAQQCHDQIQDFLDAGATYPVLKTEHDDLELVMRTFAPNGGEV